mmetsp:Transcript_9262/g.29662  ORF Transcript_9262/g.29662 Transcript_9262/m.29662 type:complete len:358 (+) Transcript_9262:237-1310(+)
MEEGRYIYDSLPDDDYDGLPPDDSLSLEEEATDAGDAPVMGLLVAPACFALGAALYITNGAFLVAQTALLLLTSLLPLLARSNQFGKIISGDAVARLCGCVISLGPIFQAVYCAQCATPLISATEYAAYVGSTQARLGRAAFGVMLMWMPRPLDWKCSRAVEHCAGVCLVEFVRASRSWATDNPSAYGAHLALDRAGAYLLGMAAGELIMQGHVPAQRLASAVRQLAASRRRVRQLLCEKERMDWELRLRTRGLGAPAAEALPPLLPSVHPSSSHQPTPEARDPGSSSHDSRSEPSAATVPHAEPAISVAHFHPIVPSSSGGSESEYFSDKVSCAMSAWSSESGETHRQGAGYVGGP